MIMLLALPVIAAVVLAHRYLVLYAPTNVLIRRVRASAPALGTAAAMLAVASGLILAMKVVSDAAAAGGPGWLNLAVLVLAWDAVRIGMLACWVAFRWCNSSPVSWRRRWIERRGQAPSEMIVCRSEI